MVDDKRDLTGNSVLLGVIPARRGSKGIRNKNLQKVLNKPLISYTIEHALTYGEIGRCIVSTDSLRIARVARRYGAEVPFLRPKELAADETGMLAVLKHALTECERSGSPEFDGVVLFDPTSPVRQRKDIRKMIELFRVQRPDLIVAVTQSVRNPYFNMLRIADDGYARTVLKGNFVRRQDAPRTYDVTNNCWIFSRKAVLRQWRLPKRTIAYETEGSWIDIDSRSDLKRFEWFVKSGPECL
jgi:CMP-N-acetylneuraminic acid synthetase